MIFPFPFTQKKFIKKYFPSGRSNWCVKRDLQVLLLPDIPKDFLITFPWVKITQNQGNPKQGSENSGSHLSSVTKTLLLPMVTHG